MAIAILLGLVLLVGAGVRFGVRTDLGRSFVAGVLDGLELGPAGRLRVKGMKGDLFSAFGFAEVSVVDAKGPWLTASDVALTWDPLELLGRRVDISHMHADILRIRRQPLLAKAGPPSSAKPPVSLAINDIRLRLETDPQFSGQRGAWDTTARFFLKRNGELRADVVAKSGLHAGDGASLHLRTGRRAGFFLRADVLEAQGGALAGALGLATDRALKIQATGDGDAASGQASGRATSGAAAVAEATIHWGADQLSAEGRGSLTASRLTQVLGDRLGPEAQFSFVGRYVKAKPYVINTHIAGANGALAAAGPVDLTRRSTPGLTLAIETADLSKWISAPKIGRTRVQGLATGSFDQFTFQGRLDAGQMDEGGYLLNQISGPVTLSHRDQEWRVGGDLRGAGGAGTTLAAALLGASPRMQADASLLKDGHILVRNLTIDGAQIKLAGSGGQGLFGRLGFKGAMDIANLGVVHNGMKGSLSSSWDANEDSGAKAWNFSFQAQAKGFSASNLTIDHVLGSSPHWTAAGAYALSSGLAIKSSQFSGSQVEVAAKGAVGQDQALALDLEWSAKGPFTAGPLQIAGAAKGGGRITGSMGAPRADLNAELSSLDLGSMVVTPAHLTVNLLQNPDGLSGNLVVAGPTAKYGAANAKGAFHVAGEDVDFTDVVADGGGVKLSGALSLRSGRLLTADLTMDAGPGAFLVAGRLQGKAQLSNPAAGPSGTIDLEGSDVGIPGAPMSFHTLKVRGDGLLTHLPLRLSADGADPAPWAFSGAGVLNHDPTSTSLSLQGAGRFRKADFKLVEPAVFNLLGPDRGVQMTLAIAGGQAKVDVRQHDEDLEGRADLTTIGVGAFNQDFTGAISGFLTVQGRGPRLAGALEANLSGVRSRDAPASEGLSGAVKAKLLDDHLHIDAVATNAEGLKSSGKADLPAEASSSPFRIAIDRTKPLRGNFSAEGEIRPLWDLIAGGERTLSGRVTTSGTLEGNLNKVLTSGQASLTGGKFRDIATGLELQNLQMDSIFGDDALTVRKFSGVDARGGSVTGEGRVSFAEDGASTFTLNLKRFQLLDNDVGRATASGAVVVTHPAKGQGKLSGSLTIDRADIVAATPTPTGVVPMDVVEIHQLVREGDEKPQPRTLGPPILLDVGIQAQRGVYVKGKGLNVELSLAAHVGGAVTQPDLSGTARVLSGFYDFAGKRFDVSSAGLIHLGTSPGQIRLDLSATWEDPTLTAVVRVQGTAAKPEITLTSTPILPQDEVLSRVLFGVSASQLSAPQGAELASALASLAGGGGFDVIGNLRQFAGLDRLALGSTQSSATTISGGKYISKDVYLELTGGARNGSGAQVEWRIRRNLSLVSRYGAALDPRYPNDTDASLSIRFRTDF